MPLPVSTSKVPPASKKSQQKVHLVQPDCRPSSCSCCSCGELIIKIIKNIKDGKIIQGQVRAQRSRINDTNQWRNDSGLNDNWLNDGLLNVGAVGLATCPSSALPSSTLLTLWLLFNYPTSAPSTGSTASFHPAPCGRCRCPPPASLQGRASRSAPVRWPDPSKYAHGAACHRESR